MADPTSVDELCQHLAAPKQLVGTLDWKRVNSTERIATAIEIEGVLTRGLGFRITCNAARPDEQVAVVLLIDYRSKPRPFARIDWRGQGHENTNRLCAEHRFCDAGRTHFHDPELHRHIEIAELFSPRLDLPVARALHTEPKSFDLLLATAADLLHIENLREIPIPPWSPQASFTQQI